MIQRSVSLPILVIFVGLCAISSCTDRPEFEMTETSFPELSGEYLGQKPPGEIPGIFAPGIVNTGLYTRDMAMMPDGSEMYFCVTVGGYAFTALMATERINGIWTEPHVVPFTSNPKYHDIEPAISPDGSKFYFVSDRPLEEGSEELRNEDIWVADRKADGWGEPYNLGPPVNSDDSEFFPSVTADGTIYFTRGSTADRSNYIYRSRFVEGVYTEPERLGTEVNATRSQYNAFISPDESYIIVCMAGLPESVGGIDYYISFRDENDVWTGPINLGSVVNTEGSQEFSPYVSPDGKYFFFMSTRIDTTLELVNSPLSFDSMKQMHMTPGCANTSIYWMNASFIDDLRPENGE